MSAVPFARLLRPVAGVVLLAGLVPPFARGADPASGPLADIRARMTAFVDQGEIAGAVTVIGRRDAILDITAVGSQDLEKHRPMTKDAVFRIASMTKPVTAIGIMILVDEGKLSVDDAVEKYLPEFRGQLLTAARSRDGDVVALRKPHRPITLRDLLTHTSGLPGWPAGLADIYQKRNRTLAEGILVMSQRPLEFEPGSRWAYCNTGIDTLGRIIEVASGQRYEDFLQARIFEPLGMTDTTFYPTPAQRERLAINYDKRDGRLIPATNTVLELPETGAKYPVPAGGLYSTAADLGRLYQMMLSRGAFGGKRVVSEKAVAEMTRVQTGALKTGFVDGMGFGFGWGVVREPKDVTADLSSGTYGHGGAFGTQAWLDPAKDLFTVLLIQRNGLQNSDATAMRRELHSLAATAVKN
jgi:CubicO group peptidase (beta-lactamase class C family)